MKNVEKRLANYIKGATNEPTELEIITWINNDANEFISILFRLLNKSIEGITGDKNLKNEMALFKYLSAAIRNSDEANRRVVIRKLTKLDEKISRLKEEKRAKFSNIKKAYTELEKMRAELYKVQIETADSNTQHYDFISYLIINTRNINYIEYVLKKHPTLINAKDASKNSLISNIINKYIKSIVDENEKDISYYENLITIILNLKSLNFSEQEKKKMLDIIYKVINKLSYNKQALKKNNNKLVKLQRLIDTLKGTEKREKKIELIASKYHIDIYFSDALLAKSKLLKVPKIGEKTERKVVNDYIITIDEYGAVEIDDGLSCKKLANGNYLLGVHIASVLGYLPYESEIVQEALNRNSIIYLPFKYTTKDNHQEKVIPMFPYNFSVQTAALLPKKPKLARSYYFEIDTDGNIVNEQFLKTIITSSRRATYYEIDKVLEEGSPDKKLETLINNLREVTIILDKKYQEESLYEGVKENKLDYQGLRLKREGAQKLVYQAMLLTGNRVATFFADSGYPCLYRVHETNYDDIQKLKELIKTLTDNYGGEQYKNLYQLIEGIYPRGWYATSGSHDGLGIDHYCHCTSELRRGADIVVEHALEVCYDKQPTDTELLLLSDEIEQRAASINSKQSSIEYFVKEYKGAYQKHR